MDVFEIVEALRWLSVSMPCQSRRWRLGVKLKGLWRVAECAMSRRTLENASKKTIELNVSLLIHLKARRDVRAVMLSAVFVGVAGALVLCTSNAGDRREVICCAGAKVRRIDGGRSSLC